MRDKDIRESVMEEEGRKRKKKTKVELGRRKNWEGNVGNVSDLAVVMTVLGLYFT